MQGNLLTFLLYGAFSAAMRSIDALCRTAPDSFAPTDLLPYVQFGTPALPFFALERFVEEVTEPISLSVCRHGAGETRRIVGISSTCVGRDARMWAERPGHRFGCVAGYGSGANQAIGCQPRFDPTLERREDVTFGRSRGRRADAVGTLERADRHLLVQGLRMYQARKENQESGAHHGNNTL